MAITNITLSDPVSTLVTKTNQISQDLGDRATLTTPVTSSLVAAINNINGRVENLDTAAEVATAVERYFDSGNKFDIGGITFDSGRADKVLKFVDDARLVFGTDSDMHIYHNGGGDTILHQIDASKYFHVKSDKFKLTDDNDIIALDVASSVVTLRFAGVSKLYTEPNGVTFTQRARFSSGGTGGFSIVGQAGDDNMIALKPLRIKNSSGSVVFAGYLVSGSTDSATL